MPKQQNLSLNESASIQYGAYGCYGRTALNPWLTVDGIQADHQHVFVSRFDKTGTKLNTRTAEKKKSRTAEEGKFTLYLYIRLYTRQIKNSNVWQCSMSSRDAPII